jgi:glutathione S-transferase
VKLYYAETLMPRKVCALAKHLGLSVDYELVDLGQGHQRAAPFKALNPNAKVPVLVDGDVVLWESNAILVHLARKAGSDLWPDDQRQVDIIRWFMWETNHFTKPGGSFYMEYVIKAHYGLGEPDPVELEKAAKAFKRGAKVLEDHLADRDWMVGDSVTVADFSVGAMMAYRHEACLPLDDFPAIRRWADRLDAIPAWAQPYPA